MTTSLEDDAMTTTLEKDVSAFWKGADPYPESETVEMDIQYARAYWFIKVKESEPEQALVGVYHSLMNKKNKKKANVTQHYRIIDWGMYHDSDDLEYFQV